MADPSAATHNYEKIKGWSDPNLRSVRIDLAYRGIVLKPEKGNVYVLLWVDHHDEAYAWAAKRICKINPETGVMQVVLTEKAVQEVLDKQPAKPVPPTIEKNPPPAKAKVFATYSDADLLSLGVPETLLPLIRDVDDNAGVEQLEKILPRDAYEALFFLADGYTIDQVKKDLGIENKDGVDTNDFAGAVEVAGSKRQFVVITDASEMEKILAAPLSQWRVFLHPSQRRLVEKQVKGPIRVLGGAGTGKTVVAMHRAVWLAQRLVNPGDKILFTTFTKNLAADISENLKSICSHNEWERIDVMNLDAWTIRFLAKQEFPMTISYDDKKRDDLWKNALMLLPQELDLPKDFIRSEWDNVIQAYGIEDLPGYLQVSRIGRKRSLSRLERKQLWPVFEEYRASMTERGICEPADTFRTAAKLIRERKIAFPYRAVVVDEAQDFGNEAFRLLRTLVPDGDNDLFIVGDAHQRLYGQQVVLSRCGIDIKGRGHKLRINYRTTEEVKNWATRLLKGLSFDNLDGEVDDGDGVRSLVHGEPPVIQDCASITAAAEAACAHIKHLLEVEKAAPETICLVAKTHNELDTYTKYVKNICSDVYRIEPEKADHGTIPGIRLATIHRVKGLEFDHVIICGKVDTQKPSLSNEGVLREKSLFYVAATRARKSLLVCKL
jgi:superfamily I DNA/RNA helicase